MHHIAGSGAPFAQSVFGTRNADDLEAIINQMKRKNPKLC
jgi:hypothetical protein